MKTVTEIAIDFIDQMRVSGYEGLNLPAEYDTLVDAVKPYRKPKLPRVGILVTKHDGQQVAEWEAPAIELTDEVRQLLSTGCAFTEGELVLEIEKAQPDDVYKFSRGLAIALTQACQAKVAHLRGVIES